MSKLFRLICIHQCADHGRWGRDRIISAEARAEKLQEVVWEQERTIDKLKKDLKIWEDHWESLDKSEGNSE